MLEHIKDVHDLKIAIQSVIVKDYGDFKRKVILYLNRFAEVRKLSAADREVLYEMVDKIQFHPNLDIEKTRSWALAKLNSLKH